MKDPFEENEFLILVTYYIPIDWVLAYSHIVIMQITKLMAT